MELPLHEKQFSFWKLRREGLRNMEIARRYNISRQAVSKALITADAKIEDILLGMADANRIEPGPVNTEYGILFGRSIPLSVDSIIFISAKYGIQVWYEHEGDCGSCQRYRECIELLWDFAEEMNISLEETDDPTGMAGELFGRLRGMVDGA